MAKKSNHPERPKKPYATFPLSPHASGAWQKKIRGKIHYFGKWGRRINGKLVRIPGDGWKEALEIYKAQADDLHAGKIPRVTHGDVLTVRDLCNRFYTAKKRKLEAGEIGSRTFTEYEQTTDLIIQAFGKNRLVSNLASNDFEALRADMANRWGPVRLGNAITRVKSVFKYAFENGLIESPMRYGSEFIKPSKAVIRKHKATVGKKFFTNREIQRMLDRASLQMNTMILLGINCALGNTDVANLQISHLDLHLGWLDYPRPKTGIERRCPLWPQTIHALKKTIAARHNSKHSTDSDCVFITMHGYRFVRSTGKSRTDRVTDQFGKLLRQCDINNRDGIGFYTLRHTFRTIADGVRDQIAANVIMGHADGSIADNYRHEISNERLETTVEYVKDWLFGNT